MILNNTFVENFRMAFSTLINNKLRSLLTDFWRNHWCNLTVMLMSSIISGINGAALRKKSNRLAQILYFFP